MLRTALEVVRLSGFRASMIRNVESLDTAEHAFDDDDDVPFE